MEKRLQQFLSAEGITQTRFAEVMGVTKGSVSQLLAGRNRPGYDFIEKLLKNFPDINIDWLITGKGRMYKRLSPSTLSDGSVAPSSVSGHAGDNSGHLSGIGYSGARPNIDENTLFSERSDEPVLFAENGEGNGQDSETEGGEDIQAGANSRNAQTGQNGRDWRKEKRIEKVVVFYTDGTFKEL